jgi:hypothetical protein
MAEVDRSAVKAAAGLAFAGQTEPTPAERRMRKRQGEVRLAWLAEAERLSTSADPADRTLADQIKAFVADMPAPTSRRETLARQLIAINEALGRGSQEKARPDRERERTR